MTERPMSAGPEWGWAHVVDAPRMALPDALPHLPRLPGIIVVWWRDGQLGSAEVTADLHEWVGSRLDARLASGAMIAWFETRSVPDALVKQEQLFAEYRPLLNPGAPGG